MKRGDPSYQAVLPAARDSTLSSAAALRALATLIDGAGPADRADHLHLAVEWGAQLGERELPSRDRAVLHYYLGNAWGHLDRLAASAPSWERPAAEHEIRHLRTGLQLAGAETARVSRSRRGQMLTNLGIAMQQACGRVVEAIASFDRALEMDASFDMARGNRGLALVAYADMVHAQAHSSLLTREAHTELVRALAGRNLQAGAREAFTEMRHAIEQAVSNEYLTATPHVHRERLGRSKREIAYRLWSLHERLVLNPLNELGPRPIAALDTLTLPGIVLPLGHGLRYHGFFNQLKQEFAAARYLCYEGIHSDRPHFSDRGVLLADTLDRPVYSLAAEKVKAAYRLAYSLLDKTAAFLNIYFEAGISSDGVSFRSMWYEQKKGRKGALTLRPALYRPDNAALRALFWLAKDLSERGTPFAEAIEPAARESVELRNHLEHKYLKLHWEFVGPPRRPSLSPVATRDVVVDDAAPSRPSDEPEGPRDVLAISLGREDFEQRTLWVLRTARAALLYTSLAVHFEERSRAATHPHPERIHTDEVWHWRDDMKV